MVWNHNSNLIFPGGNEYRKFETLDPTHATMGVERVSWDVNDYHAWIFTDEPRANYLYDEDANGTFCIRNSDNVALVLDDRDARHAAEQIDRLLLVRQEIAEAVVDRNVPAVRGCEQPGRLQRVR